MLVFDVTSRESFSNVQKWVSKAECAGPDVVKLLVAAKCDLPDRRVTEQEARDYASSL